MTVEHHKIIEKNRAIIKNLQNQCDEIFDSVCNRLNISEDGVNWLFDYMFNSEIMTKDDESFAEYLQKFGKRYEEFFEG